METYLVIIALSLVSSILLLILKPDLKKLEKLLQTAALISLMGVLGSIFLVLHEYRLRGDYTTFIIWMTFFISCSLLFGITHSKWIRFLTGIITLPTIGVGIVSLFNNGYLMLLMLPFIICQTPEGRFKMDETYHVEVMLGGFLSCGQSLYVMKPAFMVLNRIEEVGSSACIVEIEKIETLTISKNEFTFLIHHNDKFRDENPILYKIDRKQTK